MLFSYYILVALCLVQITFSLPTPSLQDKEDSVWFQSACPQCELGECRLDMQVKAISNETQIIVMCSTCSDCSYSNIEYKTGNGPKSHYGRQVSLQVNPQDKHLLLEKTLYKSESCSVSIPELDLTLEAGTAQYTTLEHFMVNMYTELQRIPMQTSEFHLFLNQLQQMMRFEQPFTLVFRDPLGHSFIEDEAQLPLVVTEFERSLEEQEEWGLLQDS